MRFRKGDRVEVMKQRERQVSWRVGVIMSGSDPTYRVQYDCYPGMSNEQMTETVSKQFLRPCPPLVQGVESCLPGDIVEVFHYCLWKLAVILKVPQCSTIFKSKKICFNAVVRLLGCTEELTIGIPNIRMRQIWRIDKWILLGNKSEEGIPHVPASKPSTSNHHRKSRFKITPSKAGINQAPQQNYINFLGDAALWETPIISSRSLKRKSPYDSSIVETHNGSVQKLRAVEKDSKKSKIGIASGVKKVHAVAYPKCVLGGKNEHGSLKTISNGYYNQMERSKPNGDHGSFSVRSSELDRSDSDECSVGSCSVTALSPNNHYDAFIPMHCQEADTASSDAESCCGLGFDRKSDSITSNEEVEIITHRLELCAYRRTLHALHASGPLTWDRESLLTDLRGVLNISNEEHSMELKLLTKKAIIFR